MRPSSLSFSFLLLAVGLTRVAIASLPSYVPNDSLKAACGQNAEAALACGGKLSFAETRTLDEIELVPVLGPILAERIHLERNEIVKRAQSFPPDKRWRAFELVFGIGEKTAASLGKYFYFEKANEAEVPNSARAAFTAHSRCGIP